MVDLGLVGWNDMKSFLRKSLRYPINHWNHPYKSHWAIILTIVGILRVSSLVRCIMIWLGKKYGTSSYTPFLDYSVRTKVRTEWVRLGSDSSLDDSRVQINPWYSLTMCPHGMCPSSTIGMYNTLYKRRVDSGFHT